MNISPRRSEINMIKSLELDRWVFPKGLEGKVVGDFERLQGILPADPDFGDVFVDDTEELVRYVRKMKKAGSLKSVAYRCPRCRMIVIGPPKMIVQESIIPRPSADLIMPGGYKAKGSTGLDYMCSNCNAYLGSHPWSEHH
jgi:hypothetical protein